MSILSGVDDKRHFEVPEEKAFKLHDGEVLRSLDDLSEAINLIEPELFMFHVNAEKNDFASWVQHVFEEPALAEQLRLHPTPLRMMVSIEKYLRAGAAPVATQPTLTVVEGGASEAPEQRAA